MTNIKEIGVVGAGVMGQGLACDLAQHGLGVVLIDRDDKTLAKAKKAIRYSLLGQAMTGGSSKQESTAQILDRIRPSTDLADLRNVDFVVENVTEKWNIKKDIYPVLDEVCRSEIVFAANTSAIPITRIASLTRRPTQILGMHFMNPVPMKKTVEVIRGYHTSDRTIETALGFLNLFNKNGVLVNDAPGFVSNRVLMLTINEAAFLVQDRVAEPADVDKIFRECFGHTMGPLATADLIGLDTILYSIEVLYEEFNDSKYRPCPLLKKMVDAGLHGCKSGAGFFQYA